MACSTRASSTTRSRQMAVQAGTTSGAAAQAADTVLLRRHRLAMFGLIVLSTLTVAVLLGPIVYPRPIDDIDVTNRLDPPSVAHPLGTDDLGQDLLARILYGGRVSIAV